jgi:hypothetical protein
MPPQVCQVHGRKFTPRAGCPYCKHPKTRKSLRLEADQLLRALWRFIEDVTEEDPARTDKFFALRCRVREYCEHADAA